MKKLLTFALLFTCSFAFFSCDAEKKPNKDCGSEKCCGASCKCSMKCPCKKSK